MAAELDQLKGCSVSKEKCRTKRRLGETLEKENSHSPSRVE